MAIASIPSQKYVPSDLIFYYILAFYCFPDFAQPLPPTFLNDLTHRNSLPLTVPQTHLFISSIFMFFFT